MRLGIMPRSVTQVDLEAILVRQLRELVAAAAGRLPAP
jgi:hypothetical protein